MSIPFCLMCLTALLKLGISSLSTTFPVFDKSLVSGVTYPITRRLDFLANSLSNVKKYFLLSCYIFHSDLLSIFAYTLHQEDF